MSLLLRLLPLICLPACTVVSTPEERVNLSQKVMLPDRDPLGDTMSDHMYYSREASHGGNGIGGGGCGCN